MSEKVMSNSPSSGKEQPIPIDYEPTVPEEVIGKCCYFDKCVWRTRIISTVFVAERLYSRGVAQYMECRLPT